MKKSILAALIALTTFSSFAAELEGVRCSKTFVVHEKNKRLKIDRVTTANSLMGFAGTLNGINVLTITDEVKSFGESSSGDNGSFGIDFNIYVGTEQSSIEVIVYNNDQKLNLGLIEFPTNQGITHEAHLSDFIKFESRRGKDFRHFTDVIVTCLPAY